MRTPRGRDPQRPSVERQNHPKIPGGLLGLGFGVLSVGSASGGWEMSLEFLVSWNHGQENSTHVQLSRMFFTCLYQCRIQQPARP